MRNKAQIRADVRKSTKGEFCSNGNRIIVELMLDIRELLKKRTPIVIKQAPIKTKRKPSEWNKFVGKYLSEGKTIQEAAKDWKKK